MSLSRSPRRCRVSRRIDVGAYIVNEVQLYISLGGHAAGYVPFDDITRDDPVLAEAVATLDEIDNTYGSMAQVVRRWTAFWGRGPRGFEIVVGFARLGK